MDSAPFTAAPYSIYTHNAALGFFTFLNDCT